MKSLVEKVRDSLLNLIRDHRSPKDVAAGLAVGVWIGVSPFWGFHTLLAIAISLVCRLNTPAVLLGTMISNPWFAPFVIFLSLQLGLFVLSRDDVLFSLQEIRQLLSNPTWERACQEILLPYVVGSILLGTLMALVTFWLTLRVAKRVSSAPSSSH